MTFKIIKKIIDEWDPHGLLAMECPDDEYHPEIEKITYAILQLKDKEKLADIINETFTHAFGGDYRKSRDCFIIAEKIKKML